MSDFSNNGDTDELDADFAEEQAIRESILKAHERGQQVGEQRALTQIYAALGRQIAAQLMPSLVKTWDESKHPRDHGKFSHTPGASGEEQTADSTPSKASQRAQSFADAAAKIEVTDDSIGSDKEISRRDLDEIESVMTPQEKLDMEDFLDSQKQEYINDQMNENSDALDDDVIAQNANWSDKDVRKKAMRLIGDVSNSDEISEDAEEAIDSWYDDTRRHGLDAIDELADELANNDDLSELAEKVRDLRSEAESDIDAAREEAESDLRSSLGEDYDDSSDRVEYLRSFYDNADDARFSGELETDKWGKDGDGDDAYAFDTTNGNRYTITVFPEKYGEHEVKELVFSDNKGSFKVTGAGGAHEVFSNVVPAVSALLSKREYPALSFTAAEPSRQRLYDRLVRTVAATNPDYAAIAITPNNGPKRYLVVRRDQLDNLKPLMDKMAGEMKVESLVKSYQPRGKSTSRIQFLEPATEKEHRLWRHPKSWSDETESSPPNAHAALLLAALDHRIKQLESGSDDDGGEHLLNLWDDPEQLASLLHGTASDEPAIQKALTWSIFKAWDENLHPRADNGRFVSREAIHEAKSDPAKAEALRERVTDPTQRKKLDAALAGETDTGRTKAGLRKEASQARKRRKESNRAEARELSSRLLLRPDQATPEDYKRMAELIQSGDMRADELRSIRVKLAASFKGGRRMEDMVSALLDHVNEKVRSLTGDDEEFEASDTPSSITSRKADAAYESVRDAVKNGASLREITHLYGRAHSAADQLPEGERAAFMDKLRSLFPEEEKTSAPDDDFEDETPEAPAASGPLLSDEDRALIDKRRASKPAEAALPATEEKPAEESAMPASAEPELSSAPTELPPSVDLSTYESTKRYVDSLPSQISRKDYEDVWSKINDWTDNPTGEQIVALENALLKRVPAHERTKENHEDLALGTRLGSEPVYHSPRRGALVSDEQYSQVVAEAKKSHRDRVAAYKQKLKAYNDEFGSGAHRLAVQQALESGKAVPPEVLAEYPDLAAKYAPAEPSPASADLPPALSASEEPSPTSREEVSPPTALAPTPASASLPENSESDVDNSAPVGNTAEVPPELGGDVPESTTMKPAKPYRSPYEMRATPRTAEELQRDIEELDRSIAGASATSSAATSQSSKNSFPHKESRDQNIARVQQDQATKEPLNPTDSKSLGSAATEVAAQLHDYKFDNRDPENFLPHKVLNRDVYEALKPRLGDMTFDEFKAALIKSGVAGHVNLEPIDMRPDDSEHQQRIVDSAVVPMVGHSVAVPRDYQPPVQPSKPARKPRAKKESAVPATADLPPASAEPQTPSERAKAAKAKYDAILAKHKHLYDEYNSLPEGKKRTALGKKLDKLDSDPATIAAKKEADDAAAALHAANEHEYGVYVNDGSGEPKLVSRHGSLAHANAASRGQVSRVLRDDSQVSTATPIDNEYGDADVAHRSKSTNGKEVYVAKVPKQPPENSKINLDNSVPVGNTTPIPPTSGGNSGEGKKVETQTDNALVESHESAVEKLKVAYPDLFQGYIPSVALSRAAAQAIKEGHALPQSVIDSGVPSIEAHAKRKLMDAYGSDYKDKIAALAAKAAGTPNVSRESADGTITVRQQQTGPNSFFKYEKGHAVRTKNGIKIVASASKPYIARHDGSVTGYHQDIKLRDPKPKELDDAERAVAAREATIHGGEPRNQDYPDLKKEQMAHYSALVNRALGR